MRPYLLNPELPLPVTFAEWTSLITRRPLENKTMLMFAQAYQSLNAANNVRYLWYAGDHDFPPEARSTAVEWFRQHFTTLWE